MKVLLILAIIIGCAYGDGTSTNPSSSHFFNRKLLKHIKSYIDVEANPCDDFYQYACGKWSEQNPIPKVDDNDNDDTGDEDDGDDTDETDKNVIPFNSAVTKVNYEINAELVQYMNGMSRRNKPEFVKKAHTFYMSCTGIGDYSMLHVVNWMEKHENMTWALLSPPRKSNVKFDWVHTLAVMRRYGMNGIFIEEEMFERFEDTWQMVIDLNKPIQKEGFTSLTYTNWTDLLENFDLPSNTQPQEELWQEISKFEQLLLKLNDIQDEEGHKYTTVKALPLAWLIKYIGIVLDRTTLDLNMDVSIENIPYMKALGALLKEYDSEFICRYLEVRFLWHLYQTPTTFSEVDCMGMTRGILSLPMNWIYEQQHPELEDEIPKIHAIFDNIVENIKKELRSDTSGIITEEVLSKLDKLRLKVGNLPRMDTAKVLDAFYDRLTLNVSDFYGNQLKLLEFHFNVTHTGYGNYATNNISQLFYLDTFDDGSSYLPYYLRTPNVVVAPLTLMRQPFYHWGYDDVYKYSSLGTRFAFIIFDGILDFADSDSLMEQDLRQISEIGGVYAAYKALVSLLPDNLKEEKFLKGTQLIFFLNYAQHYCEANAPLDLNYYVAHFAEFSEAFDCKLRNFLESFVNPPFTHNIF